MRAIFVCILFKKCIVTRVYTHPIIANLNFSAKLTMNRRMYGIMHIKLLKNMYRCVELFNGLMCNQLTSTRIGVWCIKLFNVKYVTN